MKKAPAKKPKASDDKNRTNDYDPHDIPVITSARKSAKEAKDITDGVIKKIKKEQEDTKELEEKADKVLKDAMEKKAPAPKEEKEEDK